MRSGNRCGSEDAREQGATPMTSNQQLQAQDPTPQRDRGIMPRTINRAQGWEVRDRIGEGGGGERKRRVTDAMGKKGETWAEGDKT